MAYPDVFARTCSRRKKKGSYLPETPSYYNVDVSEEERKARKEKKRQDWEKYQTRPVAAAREDR